MPERDNRHDQRARVNLVVGEDMKGQLSEIAAKHSRTPSAELRRAVEIRFELEELLEEGYYLTKPPVEGEVTPVIPLKHFLK